MGNVSRLGNIFEDVAVKAAVRLASTSAIATLIGLQTIDGIAGADGDRVLLAGQADPAQNGIWQITTGNWIRTADARDNTDFIDGTLVPVARGTRNAGKIFLLQCTDDPIVIGTSPLAFPAQSDVLNAQQSATSSSSVAIGVGARTFAIATGKAFQASQYVLIYETANPDNAMLAKVSSYAGGSLVVSVVSTSGAGTFTDWTIVLANSPASAGRVPPVGSGNTTGAGSSTPGHLATFADATGKVLADSGIAPGTLAGRATLLYGDAGTATIPQSALVPGAAPLGYSAPQPADNLRISNDAISPTRDVNVTVGRCRSDDDATNLHLAGTIAKRLDQAWAAGGAVGAPAGGCDSGVKGANQTWHLFLIAKRNLVITAWSRTSNVVTITVAGHGGGVGGTVRAFGIGSGGDAIAAISAVTTNTISFANTGADQALTSLTAVADIYDVLGSQSYATPTLPSGWSVKQCLGSVLTDGAGNVRPFVQFGDEFIYAVAVAAQSIASGTPGGLYTVPVPNGVSVMARLEQNFRSTNIGATILYYPPAAGTQAVNTPTGNISFSVTVAGTVDDYNPISVLTNTVQQIGVSSNGVGTITWILLCTGWRDPRRRLF